MERNHNIIDVVYYDNNNIKYAKFKIERPLDRTEIIENNIVLIIKDGCNV